jgi:hypothetical protein
MECSVKMNYDQWDLAGLHIRGQYLDFDVSGIVESSRVAYGGNVKHTIVLDKPLNVYGAIRDRVIVNHEFVDEVFSNV